MLDLERELLANPGSSLIAFDEVGRGAVAGPLCVGAVYLTLESVETVASARDSKSMSANSRARLFADLSTSVRYSLGWVDAAEVDALGVTASLRKAAALARDPLPEPTSFLVDGNLDFISPPSSPDPRVVLKVKGDASCASIAAASILAKVTRDELMIDLDQDHPGYGFASHKGYGTRAHYEAINSLGFSSVHRRSWKLPGWVHPPLS